MYGAEFVAGVLAGMEGTIEELLAGVGDHALEKELSSIADKIAELRLSIDPHTDPDADELSETAGADPAPAARHPPTPEPGH